MEVIFSGYSGGSFIILTKLTYCFFDSSLLGSVLCRYTYPGYETILTIIQTSNIVEHNTCCKTEIGEKRELVHRLRKKKLFKKCPYIWCHNCVRAA